MPRDVTIILAAAGAPSSQPSWTIPLPDGRPALASVIERLRCKNVSRLVFVCLKSHVQEYCDAIIDEDLVSLIERVNIDLKHRVSVLMLEEPTKSAVDTICYAIKNANVHGAIFIKDADGAFDFEVPDAAANVGGGSSSSYCIALKINDGNINTLYELTRKSFVQQCGGLLTNIVEKKIISDMICVGGYGFSSAEEYLSHAKKLENVPPSFSPLSPMPNSPVTATTTTQTASSSSSTSSRPPGVLFNSDILLSMLANQQVVSCRFVESFNDWKSQVGISRFSKSFENIVISFEDQLCERTKGNGGFHTIELAAMKAELEFLSDDEASASAASSPTATVVKFSKTRAGDDLESSAM